MQSIILGGGCFWCIEAAFERLRGVHSVVSGYAGGHTNKPDYQSVCTGQTGHAEVVKVEFDDTEIDLRSLLEVFFTVHDPTTLNRQGNDVGSQYRSVIFYFNEEQRRVARELMDELDGAGIWPSPIVTELLPAPAFYPAEDYHQGYYRSHAQQPYCQVVIAPKLKKLRDKYRNLLVNS